MLVQLAYISRAVKLMDSDDLKELLRQARDINRSDYITGMLLYKDKSFIQILEGQEEIIDRVYARIEKDERHTGCKVLYYKPIENRDFPVWSMGFQNLNTLDKESMDGYSDFLNPESSLVEFITHPNRARQLMLYFRAKS